MDIATAATSPTAGAPAAWDRLAPKQSTTWTAARKQGGDLDNRVKTLFDALRLPEDGEMHCWKAGDPEPFYCLLENDSLISDFSVETGRLLTKPQSNANEVSLVIKVTVKVTQVRSYNA